MKMSTKMKTRRRSLLYFPASQGKWYEKLPAYEADAFIFDLEDAVKDNPSSKEKARETLVKKINLLLGTKNFTNMIKQKDFFIRINGVRTTYFHKDLETVLLNVIPDAIILPKVESSEDIKKLETILEHYESIRNIPKIEIIPTIETLKGEQNAEEILTSSTRITTVQFGENGDYTASYGSTFPLNVMDDPIANNFMIKILKLTKMYEILFIDGVYFKKAESEKNKKELEERCKYIKRLGANGKAVIHPSQIPIVNKIFGQELYEDWRKKIREKYERHLKTETDSAYFSEGDKLVGPTHYKAATKGKSLEKIG